MKGKMVKRLLAVGLSIAMAVTTFQTVGTSGPGIVQAASTVTNENLLKNPTFEEGVDLGTHSDSNQNNKVGNWFAYSTQNPGTVKKVQENAHNGEWSATVAKQNDALEQDVRIFRREQHTNFLYGQKIRTHLVLKHGCV